jgi:hypothetical protein
MQSEIPASPSAHQQPVIDETAAQANPLYSRVMTVRGALVIQSLLFACATQAFATEPIRRHQVTKPALLMPGDLEKLSSRPADHSPAPST